MSGQPLFPEKAKTPEKKRLKRRLQSIRFKIFASFFSIFTIFFFGMNLAYLYGVPFTKISGIEKQYKKEAFLSLGTVADTKKDRLLSWFNERRGDIFFNANNSNLLLRVKPLAELANEKSNAGLTGKALFSILNKRPEYENINMRMRKLKQAYKSYGDIKIADTETGKIIYSTDISELGTNISKEAYFYKPAKSRDIYFTDISMCARHKVPTLIMAAGMPAPVESATEALPRKIPAVLIFEIDPTDVFRDILHTGDGLGKSGEALLVNRDIRIISALKHPLANGEKAKILKYRIKAMPAHLAAQGKEAALEANDYRGTPVLAVTRSIAISPDFSWGLVVKRDKAELLAPLAEDMNFLLFLSIGCSLMAFIVLGIMTRTLTYPIKKLSSAAEQVAAGDLTARTAIHSSDELGTLAATFDQMVQRLQSWNAELEAQITERTAQLGSSNAALRESELQYRTLFDSAGDLIAIHRFGKFIEINRVGCERLGYSHEELLNMGPAEISDPESAALLPERFDELREHGQITFETTHITRSGKKIPTEINTKLIEYAGKPAVLSIARDITERKRADETIRANEEKYRRLFDVEPDALQLVDAETLDILDVNEASCALFEYSKEEFLKLKITAISAEPDDTSARIKKGVSGATVRVPLRLCRKKNGEIFPVEMSLVFFEIDGKQRLFGALRDISERHRAEEALRQSEEKYRELVENANSIILRLDTSGNFTFINEFAQKFFGFPEEEILGRNVVGTIVPKVETGGRDLEAMVADVMAQPEEYGTNINENVRRNGERVWVAWTNKPVCNPDGSVREILAVGSDITALKHAEEELQRINRAYRAISECNKILIHSKEENELLDNICRIITEVGDFRLAWVGYAENDEQKTVRPVAFAGHDGDYNNFLNVQWADTELGRGPTGTAIRTGKPVVAHIFADDPGYAPWREKARELGFASAAAFPLTIDGKTNVALNIYSASADAFDEEEIRLLSELASDLAFGISVIRARAAHSRAEKEKTSLQQQLLQSQKMEAIGTLAGGIAHDFNNMLAVIAGNAQMGLMDAEPGGETHEAFTDIMTASERAKELTMKLLTFARKEKVNIRTVPVNGILSEVAAILKRSVPKKTAIKTILCENLPPVNVDANQIHQAILNICNNACDAMPDAGTLTIESSRCSLDEEYARLHAGVAPGAYCLVQISDTGIGMHDSVLQKIFEPFFTTKGAGKGTGLGLSITFGIIKNHGGHIYAYSEPGKGTVVKVYLPFAEGAVEETDAELFPDFITRGYETILVVDDEEGVLKTASKILGKAGYNVIAANGGKKGVAIYKEQKDMIALVVLDMIMPEMDGRDVFHTLKEFDPAVKVILSSGYSINGQAGALLKEGIKEFVQKPFNISELCGAIRKVIDG